MEDLLFAKVHIDPIDKDLARDLLMAVDQKHWFWDTYRTCKVIILLEVPFAYKVEYAKKAATSTGTAKDYEWEWKPYTPDYIRNWFEEKVFPWMGSKAGVIALMTESDKEIPPHIDCGKDEVGSGQHKFRTVLQGKTGTLYFKTKNGDVYAPEIDGPYIVDGTWPHGMKNSTEKFKLTLAAGNPWIGKEKYDDTVEILLKRKYTDLPINYSDFFRKI